MDFEAEIAGGFGDLTDELDPGRHSVPWGLRVESSCVPARPLEGLVEVFLLVVLEDEESVLIAFVQGLISLIMRLLEDSIGEAYMYRDIDLIDDLVFSLTTSGDKCLGVKNVILECDSLSFVRLRQIFVHVFRGAFLNLIFFLNLFFNFFFWDFLWQIFWEEFLVHRFLNIINLLFDPIFLL